MVSVTITRVCHPLNHTSWERNVSCEKCSDHLSTVLGPSRPARVALRSPALCWVVTQMGKAGKSLLDPGPQCYCTLPRLGASVNSLKVWGQESYKSIQTHLSDWPITSKFASKVRYQRSCCMSPGNQENWGISLEIVFAFSLLVLSQFWPAKQVYSCEECKEYEMINWAI